MNRIFVAAIALTAFAAPALADACQDDVAKLDQAISTQDLDADVKAQAEDLRNNAVQLCGAGNLDEGLAVTAEAKNLLKIE
jgi:hypothetical protein